VTSKTIHFVYRLPLCIAIADREELAPLCTAVHDSEGRMESMVSEYISCRPGDSRACCVQLYMFTVFNSSPADLQLMCLSVYRQLNLEGGKRRVSRRMQKK
jgi:hypothetical protein